MSDVPTGLEFQRQYSEDTVYTFPSGLPGFETRRTFVLLAKSNMDPLIFMRSVDDPSLCFILLPVLVIDPDYRLQMTTEELEEAGLPVQKQPRIGEDVFCGAMICARKGSPPTANLMAPVVISLTKRTGVQPIQSASGYSHQHPLQLSERNVCS